MFRDRNEELARLEEELLAQETPAQEEEEGFAPEDPSGDTKVYTNFANGYQAPEPRVYNTDPTDTDLEEFSDAVLEGPGKKPLSGILTLVFILLAAIVCLLGWCVLRLGGFL